MCNSAPFLDIATRLIVIIHSKEWRRSTNTGHFARLAVRGAEVRLHGAIRSNEPHADLADVPKSALVLYPGRGARPLTAAALGGMPKPVTLLVPDGNWNQAKHMMRRHPLLRAGQPVRLESSNLESDWLRRNPDSSRMSTFEAIVQALGILEGPETADRLLAFFQNVLGGMPRNSRRRARPVLHS